MPYLHLPQAQGAYVLHLGNTYTHSILDMSCMDAYMDACMGFPGSGTPHHDHHGQHQEDQGRPTFMATLSGCQECTISSSLME